MPPDRSDNKDRIEEAVTVKVNEQGEVIERIPVAIRIHPEELRENGCLEMVAIPGGMFHMGSRPGVGYEDERPAHIVQISPFWIGRYPVTQEQWKAVMPKGLPYRTPGEHHPADRVSWKAAVMFCERLSKQTGKPYRLPSEAEWEYACRAGTSTPFSYGPTLTTDLANYVGEYRYQQEPKGVYRHASTPVGLFPPNAFGLYDMHGNVWEWCADAWHSNYEGAPLDGSAWMEKKVTMRVLRGGGWHEPPANCRSATRLRQRESDAEDYFGFRIALSGE